MSTRNLQAISIIFAVVYLSLFFLGGDPLNKVQSTIWCVSAIILGAMNE